MCAADDIRREINQPVTKTCLAFFLLFFSSSSFTSFVGQYPPQPGYGAPPAQPGYPQAQPGYPPQQPGYPQAQAQYVFSFRSPNPAPRFFFFPVRSLPPDRLLNHLRVQVSASTRIWPGTAAGIRRATAAATAAAAANAAIPTATSSANAVPAAAAARTYHLPGLHRQRRV